MLIVLFSCTFVDAHMGTVYRIAGVTGDVVRSKCISAWLTGAAQ